MPNMQEQNRGIWRNGGQNEGDEGSEEAFVVNMTIKINVYVKLSL